MDDKVKSKLDTFFSQYKKQTYKKGEILVRADDNPSGVFYLTEGKVKVYAISEKGEEIVLNMYRPIAFFPMTWVLNDVANTYYYEAVEPLTLWKAPKSDVLAFLHENPDVVFDLLIRTYKGIDGLMMRMLHILSSSARSRVISEIVLAAKRFGEKDGAHIVVHTSEKDLSLQIGLSRETVSREMSILKKDGLISFNNRMLTIFDMEKLTSLIS